MGRIEQRLTCLSFGILELWAVAAAGRSAVDLEELGGHGGTHPVSVVCREGAVRQPDADGMHEPSQEPPGSLEIRISGSFLRPSKIKLSFTSSFLKHTLQSLPLFDPTGALHSPAHCVLPFVSIETQNQRALTCLSSAWQACGDPALTPNPAYYAMLGPPPLDSLLLPPGREYRRPPPPEAQPNSLQLVLIGAVVLVMMGEAGGGRGGSHSHPLLCAPGNHLLPVNASPARLSRLQGNDGWGGLGEVMAMMGGAVAGDREDRRRRWGWGGRMRGRLPGKCRPLLVDSYTFCPYTGIQQAEQKALQEKPLAGAHLETLSTEKVKVTTAAGRKHLLCLVRELVRAVNRVPLLTGSSA
ncbi:hypothetical protein NQZ68_013966 [Dissostichus eleginoides]|nr:hypothetical protein NQZ68_013966 [Dissostichus eleginoides]